MRNISTLTIYAATILTLMGCSDGGADAPPSPSTSDVPVSNSDTGTPSDTGSIADTGSDTLGSHADAQRAVLAQLANNVILATYTEFETAAESLKAAAKANADAPSEANATALHEAWDAAMVVWQRAESMQLGPAAMKGDAIGGQDMRDGIYSWPLTSTCRIDQETAEGTYEDPAALFDEGVNVVGLDALEYVMTRTDDTNTCKPASTLNISGAWKAVQAEIPARRAAYASTVADLIHEKAVLLANAWKSDGGNFAGELATAGKESKSFSTAQDGLNAISDAMFFVDTVVKDMKLAVPVGLSDCKIDVCPGKLESKYRNRSKEHIANNLRGIQHLFLGGSPEENGSGFDDLMFASGATDLANDMTDRIAKAITAVEAIEGSMKDALTNDPDSVVAAYNAVKAFTDLFKTDFMGVLDLEVPQRAASDND